MTILGRDLAARFSGRFAGRLQRASFDKIIPGEIFDPNNPLAPPAAPDPITYSGDALPFLSGEDFGQGGIVKRGDYDVTIMIGSIAQGGAAASLDLGSLTPHVNVVVAVAIGGLFGNSRSIVLVGTAAAKAGTITEDETTTTLAFLPASTTVGDIVALLATPGCALVVTSPGTSATVLDMSDELVATAFAGGSDATPAPFAIPNPGDVIRIAPVDGDVILSGEVMTVVALTQAQVTVRVRGAGA